MKKQSVNSPVEMIKNVDKSIREKIEQVKFVDGTTSPLRVDAGKKNRSN